VDCSGPGFSRRRAGRGFVYLDEDGKRISDPATLQRIKSLVIPPAWEDVWISPLENGHLQAVGIDAAGRKQYLYHNGWRVRRDQEKFDHMIEFARSLPSIRETTNQHLLRQDMDRQRVLACAVRLLDKGFFRVGMERYSEKNQSYGLATMRKAHVTLGENGWISFDYLAKGSKRHVKSVVDSEVYKMVEILKKRRGRNPELLAYRSNGKWIDVKSGDINSYIREITGEEFTAKDFRTWNATVLAAVALAVSGGVVRSKTARKRAMARAVQEVAHYLGNTPAVCRKSYIDPKVFDRYRAGVTIAGAMESIGDIEEFGDLSFQGPVEEAVLDLLTDTRSDAIEKVA
jgi:DNA topoisomerase-1